ncbi:MAG: oxaloacetate decarboxylase subunit alpha [Erysipelotrichaceae bacterium]|nr:oxaloacetate decarboxylase subunit alpha [Erysipelotrichaceae bacterium]
MGVQVTETCLRDGHQSLFATRMTTEEVLLALKELDQVGYRAIEIWGGATFDACLRFLDEDPWERLRAARKVCKNTKLQMLFRGQNILGYRHYADDVVEKFVEKSIKNGIDVIRIFDALNDIRNLECAVRATKKYGGECQIALSYTTSPVHTVSYYVELAKKIEALGADSICIKDMAGVMLPKDAYELISALKKNTKLPIELHSHCTGGLCEMTYLKAIEAGVDIVDCALSPLSGGTSQPCTESLNFALQGTEFDPKLNVDMLNAAAAKMQSVRAKYLANGLLNPKVLSVNANIIKYQVPGGMLSNLINQLKQQGASDKLDDVLREVPNVRKDMGYPPLVTPLSQMVGTQAVLNVISGERYKMVPKEINEYLHGRYGASPAPVNEEIRKKIIGDDPVITYRPADDLKPEFAELKKQYKGIAKSDEDVLSIALFGDVALKFINKRNEDAKPTLIKVEV